MLALFQEQPPEWAEIVQYLLKSQYFWVLSVWLLIIVAFGTAIGRSLGNPEDRRLRRAILRRLDEVAEAVEQAPPHAPTSREPTSRG